MYVQVLCFDNKKMYRVPGLTAEVQVLRQKLDQAIEITNSSLQKRNMANATTAVHSFWLYELCDVYIVGRFF